MSTIDFSRAQSDLRQAYGSGAPGVLVSGLVWLVAALVVLLKSPTAGMITLLVGGMLIHPLGIVLCKMLGRSGAHERGNPLGILAGEGTVWMIAGIAIACTTRPEWFFAAMLLVIGGRYLTFQTLYGMKAFWLLGGLLIATGVTLVLTRAPLPASVLAGAVIELVFGAVLLARTRRQVT